MAADRGLGTVNSEELDPERRRLDLLKLKRKRQEKPGGEWPSEIYATLYGTPENINLCRRIDT